MAFKKTDGQNYLPILIGGLFVFALAIVAIYAFAALPMAGCVGVVEIKGEIVSDDTPSTLFSDEIKGGDTIAEEIESAANRPDIKSILVIIDSPGGSAVASRRIYDALRAVNKSKVAYINEMAASGGYYVAAGTDYIVANPLSLTGNIGARATLSDMSGLFAKLGYNETSVKSGSMKDMGTASRPMTEEERAVFQSIVDESFEDFKSAVLEGRGSRLDMAGFKTILDARILTGRQAEKIGLVDSLGNRKDAIKQAAKMGGIESDEPRLCALSSSGGKRGIFGSLSSEAIGTLLRGAIAPKILYQ
ncbi:MAG: signal peptide peptidase SppA [Candidatus Micrarchaeia archaeon]